MTKKNWTHLFPDSILEKGEDYADNGAVKDLKVQDDRISAVVSGNYDYWVTIELKDGFPDSLRCSCPYAVEGNYCKHMAAVLFKAEERKNGAGSTDELEEIVKEMPREKLNAWALEVIRNHEELANDFLVRFSPKISDALMKKLKKEADDIFDEFGDEYVDYMEADVFFADIDHFLDERVETLVSEGHYLDAFELSLYVFFALSDAEEYVDSDMEGSYDRCMDIWKEIVGACSDMEKKAIRERLLKIAKKDSTDEYLQDLISNFIEEELWSEEENREALKKLDREIDIGIQNGGKPPAGSSYGALGAMMMDRILLMERLSMAPKEIVDYERAHISYKEVRDHYKWKLELGKDWAGLIPLLEEDKGRAARDYDLESIARELVKAYHETGKREKELENRVFLFLHSSYNSLEEFRKIKNLCPKEKWESSRHELIAHVKDRKTRCEILAEEGLQEELYREIMKDNDMDFIHTYGPFLSGKYDREILQRYEKYLDAYAVDSRSRYAYSVLISGLYRLQQYKGGKALARKLAKEWLAAYPTRKLLVSEMENYLKKNKNVEIAEDGTLF